jgi:hypothetical protein
VQRHASPLILASRSGNAQRHALPCITMHHHASPLILAGRSGSCSAKYRFCFWPEAVGAQLARDLARSGSRTGIRGLSDAPG